MTTTEALQTTIVALIAGLAIPVLVQLFISLRAVQRNVANIERRLDGALGDVSATLDKLRPVMQPSEAMSLLAATAAPAVVAGIRAFRAHTRQAAAKAPAADAHANGA